MNNKRINDELASKLKASLDELASKASLSMVNSLPDFPRMVEGGVGSGQHVISSEAALHCCEPSSPENKQLRTDVAKMFVLLKDIVDARASEEAPKLVKATRALASFRTYMLRKSKDVGFYNLLLSDMDKGAVIAQSNVPLSAEEGARFVERFDEFGPPDTHPRLM